LNGSRSGAQISVSNLGSLPLFADGPVKIESKALGESPWWNTGPDPITIKSEPNVRGGAGEHAALTSSIQPAVFDYRPSDSFP